MKGFLKRAVTGGLRPVARVAGATIGPLRRAWAHARLQTSVEGPVPASVVILGVAEVHGTGRVEMGEGLYLYPGLYLETRERGRISIGEGVVLSRGVHVVSFAGVSIGAGAMIGEYASIRDANHRRVRGVALRESGHEGAPIRIEKNAWIGRGAMVLPGVTIGEGAVVGANAVVSRDVPAGAVVGGVPARPISARSAA